MTQMLQAPTAEDLLEVVSATWSSFLGEESGELLHVDSDVVAPDERASGCVTVRGGWNGAVLCELSPCLARVVASGLFATPEADLTAAEIGDAVGELVNVVGGNVKGMVPGPSELSLPAVTIGSGFSVHVPYATAALRVGFSWCGEPLVVLVLQS
jgi:chemotaxis protein CheX